MTRAIVPFAAGFSAAVCVAFCVLPASAALAAEGLAQALEIEPPMWMVGDIELTLGGTAEGALATVSQPGAPPSSNYGHSEASGIVTANLGLRRILDNGMILGARSDILLYRDALSGDNYDSDTLERLYVYAQTGFGRVELGQQDGAAFTLGLVGPIVDQAVSLENRNISLFRDPRTGDDFAAFFQSTTAVQASSNYAKINYVSPRLFGLQLGASFTPEAVRSPLPFTGNPEDVSDRQHNIFEFGVNYTGYVSDVALGLSAGYAHGAVEHATPGGGDLEDFAFGAQIATMVSDVRLSAGGAYRISNSYLFDIGDVGSGRHTHALHISAMAEKGSWLFGVELSDASIRGSEDFDVTGYQTTLGYRLNENLQISAGWQWYDYSRSLGTFYNGRPKIGMDAGFLSLGYHL